MIPPINMMLTDFRIIKVKVSEYVTEKLLSSISV